jgi:hypothetical protein
MQKRDHGDTTDDRGCLSLNTEYGCYQKQVAFYLHRHSKMQQALAVQR